ncbi:MAG: DUF1997 domain-containing protein [Spirulinaceae cyanobacterium RM2_2_10]|nr:DUF1997 domain-containing protein [Spirulinaceae cyanobacterium SM2_1_0]NJO21167.1 DUF1997 domain-containing protein [Spirulinaceae cyanobacterium RM2_2_10]
MQKLRFTTFETVALEVVEQAVPIQHYLRQPQRLVRAIADPRLMEQVGGDRYCLKMRPLQILNLHFQPVVELKVWADARGRVYLQSESCEIRGIEYINARFHLDVGGKLTPVQRAGKTYLEGRADLAVDISLPTLLALAPRPILEATGNQVVKGVLSRIKQRLLEQLLADYRDWASDAAQQPAYQNPLSPAENPAA